MSGEGKARPREAPAEGDLPAETEGERPPEPSEDDGAADRPQEAWAALRDLEHHTPRAMGFGAGVRIGGGVLGGINHGIGGGSFHGEVHVGTTHVHYQLGSRSAANSSGEIPSTALDELADRFADPGPAFADLIARLRDERVLVLAGPHSAGRRTAALMLLHRLDATPVHAIARDTPLGELVPEQEGDRSGRARGHLLCDPVIDAKKPLREAELLALRNRLAERDAYAVITVGLRAHLEDVEAQSWQPPPPSAILDAHLRMLPDHHDKAELLALPMVTGFLARDHQPRETAEFASVLVQYVTGRAAQEEVEGFSLLKLEDQVREWFEQDDAALHLREKAFLIALAAFDEGPYALTAEVSDGLYARLQKTADSRQQAAVPVFGTHIEKRLQLARAHRYAAEEHTEWGPVHQMKAAYRDERAAFILLREVWTGHPSARPALVQWLQDLSKDGRPLVRTRAASTAAVLAYTDLPSAMALVIEPWASSRHFGPRSVAVSALALAHSISTPNVPRILDTWCDSRTPHLRWVAIRTHGLIGPERPVETLAALRAAARHDELDASTVPDDRVGQDEAQLNEVLAESVELLLLSRAQDQVFLELLRTLRHDRNAFDLAVGGFLGACGRTEGDEPGGRPLLLDRYGQSAPAEVTANHIARLWHAALGDRAHRPRALGVLRQWVRAADRDVQAERHLTLLLSDLADSEEEWRRIGHLLRTTLGEDSAPLSVASRLLAAISHP
ncbi:hypothetical protein OHA57_23270 [Streptomyces anulatus]|uniref:hypothetical protein n=1 Tax=Streptomyces anulatus TaxID=1892 RepID=UPI002DDA1788|nr:hypothetical protein [Streptomyces anulatus]WSC63472.1 hypothetical protein OHA57_23270 [Streptomyces anulatus]